MKFPGFHLLAYSASLAAGVTDTQLNAVAEQQFNRSNNSFQNPEDAQIVAMIGTGVNMSKARINCGSLLQRGLPQLFPVGIIATFADNLELEDMSDNPIQLRAEEDIRVDASQTDAGAQQMNVGLWYANQPINNNINAQSLRWVRATAAPTLTLGTWCSPVAITFQDTLEGGKYEVFGLDVMCTSAVFARLILPNQWNRPGVPCRTAVGQRGWKLFKGGLGSFGKFSTYSLPQLEILGSAAGAQTPEIRLLMGKVA